MKICDKCKNEYSQYLDECPICEEQEKAKIQMEIEEKTKLRKQKNVKAIIILVSSFMFFCICGAVIYFNFFNGDAIIIK